MCLPKATGTYQMGVGQLLNFQFEGKKPKVGLKPAGHPDSSILPVLTLKD